MSAAVSDIQYSSVVIVRCEDAAKAAIARIAIAERTKPAEIGRRALNKGLEVLGGLPKLSDAS
jgi:hypothetical protein